MQLREVKWRRFLHLTILYTSDQRLLPPLPVARPAGRLAAEVEEEQRQPPAEAGRQHWRRRGQLLAEKYYDYVYFLHLHSKQWNHFFE
jgi:hypothetical protein